VTEQGIWRVRTNKEMTELYKISDLVVDIKRRNLEWTEHVITMDKMKVAKKIKVGW
jgi:hypothetical protein